MGSLNLTSEKKKPLSEARRSDKKTKWVT